jgi:hypothetical protein
MRHRIGEPPLAGRFLILPIVWLLVMGKQIIPAGAMHKFDPRLKMRWAKRHLNFLHRGVWRFLRHNAYRVETEDDLEAGQYVVRLKVGPVNDVLGLVAGDFLSCLRASLDHLASALTLCPDGTPNSNASFPVIHVDNSRGRKQISDAVSGVPSNAVSLIESFQPYHYGNAYQTSELWRLHRLWNIDKHRRIPFHATKAEAKVRGPLSAVVLCSRSDDGSELRFSLADKDKIHVEPPVNIGVEFGDAEEGIIVPHQDFFGIYNFVADEVMPAFDGFFKDSVVEG